MERIHGGDNMQKSSCLFRRLSRTVAVSLGLCLAGPAVAAGPFDGIYQLADTTEFYSVHQSGSQMIVGNFIVANGFQIGVLLSNGQQFNTPRLDFWNLFSGPVSGSVAQLQGEAVFGACSVLASASFSETGATLTIHSVNTTPAGATQGINCTAVVPSVSSSYGLVKVF